MFVAHEGYLEIRFNISFHEWLFYIHEWYFELDSIDGTRFEFEYLDITFNIFNHV